MEIWQYVGGACEQGWVCQALLSGVLGCQLVEVAVDICLCVHSLRG